MAINIHLHAMARGVVHADVRCVVLAFFLALIAGCATQQSHQQVTSKIVDPTVMLPPLKEHAQAPVKTGNTSATVASGPSRQPVPSSPALVKTPQDNRIELAATAFQPKDDHTNGADPKANRSSDAKAKVESGDNTEPDRTLSVPPAAADYPIDLTTALRLAEVENPTIAEARQRIVEALGLQQGARVLLFPNLNAGVSYHGHTGVYQRSTGQIYSVSNQSLYLGGGAFTVGQSTVSIPGVSISTPLTDALFEPLAARQNVKRAEYEATATANTVLLEAATAYYNLVAAEASLQLQRQTETDVSQAAKLTWSYASAGQGYRSDADRASTLLKLIHRQVERGEEEAAVASVQLSRQLHLDPVVRVHPQNPDLTPIELIDPRSRIEELLPIALQRRPEMSARAAAVEVASARLKKELARPWLPTLWLGVSGGAFGGGSNIAPPLVGQFGGRTDIDVMAYWTLQNMGFGNLALQRRNRALVGEANGELSRTITTIRREVASALGRLLAARGRMDATAHQLRTAEDGFREDLIRLRNTVGRPIELTNSLELLSQARQDHLRAILEYNRAQLQLFVAMGSPPPLERPATEPIPPAPIASPVLPFPPGFGNPSIPRHVPGPPPLIPVGSLH